MGTPVTEQMQHGGLAGALFPAIKQRVLGLLFGEPERSFYTNEVIARVAGGSGVVQRELATLAGSGLITVQAIGNQKHYQANAEAPIFDELCAIVRKTIGLAEPLRDALAPLKSRITAAFVYGSVAKKADTSRSDIDLMILGDDISYGDVFTALEDAGNLLGRTVNPTLLTPWEFSRRLAREASFLTRVLSQPKIWIMGNADDLPT